MEMFRRTFAEISLDNLRHNIQVIQETFPNRFLCPMIKANAYGHGDAQLALFLETLGIEHMGVCLIEEGLLLRQSGVRSDILVFRGFDREGAEKIVQYAMTPVVSTWEQITHLEAVAHQSPVSIHLKFDTGMNRLGFNPSEADKLFERLKDNKKIRVKALLTHLYQGEDAMLDNGHSAEQLRSLYQAWQVFKSLNVFVHALNSAGIVNLTQMIREKAYSSGHPLLLTDWGLRPGLMIYGYNPVESVEMDLKPVMSLKSVVGTYRQVKPGQTVSYSGRWKAARDSIIGVVPIGYADGYHRILSNQSHVLFAGQRVPVVGTVCMDYLMIDVTDVVGGQDLARFKEQEVILFGGDGRGHFLSPEELAQLAKTITWEILTSVGERVPRVFVGSEAPYINERIGGRL